MQKIVHSQLKYIGQIKSKLSSPSLEAFVDKLYGDVTYDDLSLVEPSHLAKSAEAVHKFMSNRKQNSHLVELFRTSAEADYVVLQIVTNDVPFLIDSISNELKQQSLDIHLIIHPTWKVERDKNGKLIDFSEQGTKESIMQFHLGNWGDEKFDKKLLSRINDILHCIAFAVHDWKPMLSEMKKGVDYLKTSKFTKNHSMNSEYVAFLEWLLDNHMVVLGAVECVVEGDSLKVKEDTKKGLLRSEIFPLSEMPIDNQLMTLDPLVIRKWDKRSVVHRTAHLDQIIVKLHDDSGHLRGAYVYFGLYTSTVYYQSVREIPYMRKKVATVIERYGYPESSHNCKELITAMESFPRGELLQMSIDELYNTATAIVSLTLIPRVRMFVRQDQISHFVSVIVFIPERRFSTEVRAIIEGIICRHLNGVVSKRYVQIGESSLTRLQLIVKVQDTLKAKELDSEHIEKEIVRAISVWSDKLHEELFTALSKKEATTIFNRYKDAFDVKYRAMFSGDQAVYDIRFIEDSFDSNRVNFDIYFSSRGASDKNFIQLKIYSPDRELPLSSTLPIIENLGLFAVDVLTYQITIIENGLPKYLYIHHFRLKNKYKSIPEHKDNLDDVKDALYKIWVGEIDDDIFNSLIITAQISCQEALVLRAFAKYLKQTGLPISFETILESLRNYPEITRQLVEYFKFRFGPLTKLDEKSLSKKQDEVLAHFASIKNAIEDQVFRVYLELINAIVRTNFFQLDENNHPKDYLSFKINSSAINHLPLPKPYREIYVYSPRFEGIHLRGGKVARGGLRWSDRKDDFRTEVLGLMKAQMTKNAVIVPVGSKGGFVLKKVSMSDGQEKFMAEGVQCYKKFLSGLLDITDNVVGTKVIAPQNVIRYEEDDPYLVVAADKGTAKFSDYANQVSEKYGFWLGDAFASGGSVGYDHKKMGITAKGAWICVERHFEEMGVDIAKEPFTVVGIGDMSGDVFGNGMLLSENIKLLAAFNHMHIFIDPTPDPKASFKERKRLFELPQSQWTDYDAKLISKGGGVYSRKEKTIEISAEARAALDLDRTVFSPDELIKEILKAPVSLLWNGGIGTYVKASSENNSNIGDKANDALRVNGKEVRAKIIGEGGNLGVTQLGRIEYAKSGGRVNTDFIDNSAGVDCSDHEVNLKIALSHALRTKKMTRAQRDKLLVKMTDEVASLVLADNYKQSQIVSIEEHFAKSKIGIHAWIIKYLEERGELDRAVEYLPALEEMNEMVANGFGLTRPEISVILSYSKNSMYSMLCKCDFSKEDLFDKYLLKYFPKEFIKTSKDIIEGHKLKNEIIATVLTNDFGNLMGTTFFHQAMEDTSSDAYDVICAFVIAREVLGVDHLWAEVEKLDSATPRDKKIALFSYIQKIMERSVIWLLNNVSSFKALSKCAENYKGPMELLSKKLLELVGASTIAEYNATRGLYEGSKNLLVLAESILKLKMCEVIFDLKSVADEVNKKVDEVAKVYAEVGEKLHIPWINTQVATFKTKTYVQNVALRMQVMEIQSLHIKFAVKQLNSKINLLDSSKIQRLVKYNSFIADLKHGNTSEAFISKLTLIVAKLREIYK